MVPKLLIFSCLSVHILISSAAPDGNEVEKKGQLIFTSLIWRHGDRNPAMQYAGDKYDISYWPEGWGQLTNLGKQQQYALGQWIRKRYQHFLSNTFNVSDVYVRSSDVDRTIMSAQANLAGLYPPTGNQVWNKGIPWQPIPVHVVPGSIDYITAGGIPPCPAYQKAYNEYLQSNEIQRFSNDIQPIYSYLSANTGSPVKDFLTVLLIRDSLLCESIHNLTLPEWTKAIFPDNEKFYQAALKYYYIPSSTKFMAKFQSGYLLKDILDRFSAKIQRTLTPDLKYYAYSTHDSTCSNFLNSLGVFDFKFVPYAATIIMELRYYQNEYYVQLYYKNSDVTPTAIYIPKCGTACALSKMYQIYDEILPKNDFTTECNIVV